MMILSRMFGSRGKKKQIARDLLQSISAQSRDERFFGEAGFHDTLEGRLGVLTTHMILTLRRLRRAGDEGRELAEVTLQAFMDFVEYGHREAGAGDFTIGRKMRAFGETYLGQARVYDEALDGGEVSLNAVLRRNIGDIVFTPEAIDSFADYMKNAASSLDSQSDVDLLKGRIRWPDAEAMA